MPLDRLSAGRGRNKSNGEVFMSLRDVLIGLGAVVALIFGPGGVVWAQPARATGPERGAEIAPPVTLTVGRSTLMRLPGPIDRISIGNPAVLDVTLTGPRELYLLGKTFGSTNIMLWRKDGPVTVVDVSVALETIGLQEMLSAILPGEKDIVVRSAADSIVLAGTVSSGTRAEQAVSIAEGFARSNARTPVAAGQGLGSATGQRAIGAALGGGQQQQTSNVINLMTILQPQQVMLEVKVAEVSRSVLDQLGVSLNLNRVVGSVTWGIVTASLQDVFGSILAINRKNGTSASIDAKFDDGLVKVLAEPTIMSISGQEASFLAGGKVFIPVSRSIGSNGIPTIELAEKEFGVGLKFTPVVLDGDLISLRVAPEVSELSRTGSPFVTTGGVTTVLPSFTTRRAQTTVQMRDGQSLAIAGLIKNNVVENVSRFPFLGEIPILGALFRSTEFQSDRSELLFVITPRLVKTLGAAPPLPTDGLRLPSREELFLKGQLEGSGRRDTPESPKAPVDGLQLK
jgi:pilus assembly protein CpaC